MDATSLQFLGFALLMGLLYNLRESIFWRQSILLAANVTFLAAFAANWKQYLPLAMFVGIGYAGICLMQHRRSRILFAPATLVLVFLFVWLKRYTFLPRGTLLPFPYLTIGLSYIFFRIVHMIVDAKDEALPCPVCIIPYLNYTLNFMTIVAGPIQLFPDFAASQLSASRPELTVAQCARGVERAVTGFFKLRVLSAMFSAVQLAAIERFSEAQPPAEKLATAGVILTAYALYLYFNFSGFIDLMIGVASIFRLELPENFNRPFSATSFIEFWSRWHMTLSNWLKTYVYTPLVKVLMSKFPAPQAEPFLGVIGFFVTFFLVGAWHGQTSEFLFFGLLQGGGVSLNKLYQIALTKTIGRKHYKALDSNVFYRAISRGLTFTYFTFTLVWFWSNWRQIHRLAAALTMAQEILLWLAIWLGSAVVLALWEALREYALGQEWHAFWATLAGPARAAWAVYLAILTSVALSIVPVSTSVMYQIF